MNQIKIAEKVLDAVNYFDNKKIFSSSDFCELLAILSLDENEPQELKEIKRASLSSLSPILNASKSIDFVLERNKNKIDKVIKALGEYAFNIFAQEKNVGIENYDLFVFDADQTLWTGDKAFEMEQPYSKIGDAITDPQGHTIILKNWVKDYFFKIRAAGKSIGIISRSEKEGVNYEEQPVILLLKMFGLFDLIDQFITINADLPKSVFIPNSRRVLFIDNSVEEITEVKNNSNADTVLL